MSMIKLSDGCYVNADDIAEITVNEHRTHVTVRTKKGIGHCHEPEWRESVYCALDKLVAKINAATSHEINLQMERDNTDEARKNAADAVCALGEIYAIRGEDPDVAAICNRILSQSWAAS